MNARSFILLRDGVITLRRNRHLLYAPYPAPGVFEDMGILPISALKRACMKLRRIYILPCSTGARLIVHLSVAAKTTG